MNPLIRHLLNLKFYGEFRRSSTEKFDQFVEFIEKGAPEDYQWPQKKEKPNIERFTYSDPLEDAEFEEKVEDFLQKQALENQIPKNDLAVWFENVASTIESILNKENAFILLEAHHYIELKRLLDQYDPLRNFVKVSPEDFFEYTSWMQHRSPDDFFLIFSENNKEIENQPLINCFPRIFKTCQEYDFFLLLTKKLEYPRADLSYIFYKMRAEKLIHYYCKPEFQELIDDIFKENYTLYPEDKISDRFKNNYLDARKMIY